MKIVIVGCGKVGLTLAEQLGSEGYDITVIDKDSTKLRMVTDRVDVLGVEGNGVSFAVQNEAGVGNADLLIATTDSDELNLLCCLIAKKAGNCQTIARIRDPEYFREMHYLREELNLSMVINPEQAAAAAAARLIKFPSAVKIDTFAHGRVEMIQFVIPEGSKLDGMKVMDVSSRLHCDTLICVIEREEEVVIPYGAYILRANDKISFIASHKEALELFKAAGVPVAGAIRSLMVVGGGTLTYYLAQMLSETSINVKIIENDTNRCKQLSDALPKAMIINGDGTDQQLLMEEGIDNMDAVASFTGIDEENIMLSLYAGSKSKGKIFTKINKITFESVINSMNLGSIVNPKLVTANAIISYVRAMNNSMGSNVTTLYKIAGGKAEALEFNVAADSAVAHIPLQDLNRKKNLLIAGISRKGKNIMPNGQSTMEPGDRVVVVTTQKGLHDLEDILA